VTLFLWENVLQIVVWLHSLSFLLSIGLDCEGELNGNLTRAKEKNYLLAVCSCRQSKTSACVRSLYCVCD